MDRLPPHVTSDGGFSCLNGTTTIRAILGNIQVERRLRMDRQRRDMYWIRVGDVVEEKKPEFENFFRFSHEPISELVLL